jgi:nanoRNase/pAp phosphatase (c-di-AMP/oligoRNAs hydrolase)
VIKSKPALDKQYLRKVYELKPDLICILDKPMVAETFLNGVKEMNLPLLWIDHHKGQQPEESLKEINYYNPLFFSSSSEPVTYICYKITKKKEDIWLAMVGCIGDAFIPDFVFEFEEKYPDYFNSKDSFRAMFETKIGEITKIFNFALKDSTSNILKMQKFLIEAKSPVDVLEVNNKNFSMHKRFQEIEKKISPLIEKAERDARGELIFFQYGGTLSISAEISNELFYRHPEKIIIVAYISGAKANISIRGKMDVREITVKAVDGLENATGGGHKNACGATVLIEDLPKFKENFIKAMKEA